MIILNRDRVEPGKLWRLLDVLKVNASAFVRLTAFMRQISADLEHEESDVSGKRDADHLLPLLI